MGIEKREGHQRESDRIRDELSETTDPKKARELGGELFNAMNALPIEAQEKRKDIAGLRESEGIMVDKDEQLAAAEASDAVVPPPDDTSPPGFPRVLS